MILFVLILAEEYRYEFLFMCVHTGAYVIIKIQYSFTKLF